MPRSSFRELSGCLINIWKKTSIWLLISEYEIIQQATILTYKFVIACLVKMHVCVLSHVQLFATPWTVAHQAPLSMGFFQARILEWIGISYSRRSSQHKDWTQVCWVSWIDRWSLYYWVIWKAPSFKEHLYN